MSNPCCFQSEYYAQPYVILPRIELNIQHVRKSIAQERCVAITSTAYTMCLHNRIFYESVFFRYYPITSEAEGEKL